MEIKTVDAFADEGKERTRTERLARRACDYCGEPAHHRYTFLYHNFRSNPRSKAYGRDDCSYCCDVEVFTCRECKPQTPDGCDSGAGCFYATEMNKHHFLNWVAVSSNASLSRGEAVGLKR
jgi:hypothetical protein